MQRSGRKGVFVWVLTAGLPGARKVTDFLVVALPMLAMMPLVLWPHVEGNTHMSIVVRAFCRRVRMNRKRVVQGCVRVT